MVESRDVNDSVQPVLNSEQPNQGPFSAVGGQLGRQVGRALEVEQGQDLGGGGFAQGTAAAVEEAKSHLGGFAGDAGIGAAAFGEPVCSGWGSWWLGEAQ